MHTKQTSACGVTRGRDYIAPYQAAGYSGIVVTDHFLHGNIGIDRRLPWRDFVQRFCAGYEDAAEEGCRRGFPVFFGWEENFGGDEYLIYGLDKTFLLEHPEMVKWTRLEQYETVRAAGGCVVQAHPFRQRGYIKRVTLSTGCVDGVEVANGGNTRDQDALAYRYARRLGLPMTAGTDIHDVERLPEFERPLGVRFERPWNSIADFVNALTEKKPFAAQHPDDFNAWRTEYEGALYLPCEVRDRGDRIIARDAWSVL